MCVCTSYSVYLYVEMFLSIYLYVFVWVRPLACICGCILKYVYLFVCALMCAHVAVLVYLVSDYSYLLVLTPKQNKSTQYLCRKLPHCYAHFSAMINCYRPCGK